MQNQRDSFQFLTIVSELCAFYALSKPIHNKMSKTSLVHRNLISLHRHHYVVKKKWCWEFWKTINFTKWKSQMISENKTRSRQLVKLSLSWVTDKRITIHSARILICVVQNIGCIINILTEEVGKHHTRKEKQFQHSDTKHKIFVSFCFHIK